MFLQIRRRHVAEGHFDGSAYRPILNYEKIGRSALFAWCGLPEGCDTVFFPGCTLPGTRPKVTLEIFRYLRGGIPNLGIVLDCCTKPSHDLGREAHFNAVFGSLRDRLAAKGVGTVLVACPNCYKIFKIYGNGISVKTVYEVIHANGDSIVPRNDFGEMAVHDPCALREETQVHQAIRALLARMGITTAEMKHRGRRTLCCGEGGMVGFAKPALAKNWAVIRSHEADGRPLVAYCAGCAGFLNKETPTVHIADLLFRPEDVRNGDPRVSNAPFTYVNRLWLKSRLKRQIGTTPKRD